MKRTKCRPQVLLLTAKYPYLPGEQFIESEASYWAQKAGAVQLVIMPSRTPGDRRSVPAGIRVSMLLVRTVRNRALYKLAYVLRSLFSPLFWREAPVAARAAGGRGVRLALTSTASVLRRAATLKAYANALSPVKVPAIVYNYWFDLVAYASVRAFRGRSVPVVARAHRYDVYAEFRSYGYMPLKKQFRQKFHRVFAISRDAKEYLSRAYNIPQALLNVRHLGVELPGGVVRPTSQHSSIHVISISACKAVKRIDRLIAALALLGSSEANVRIRWTHYGDGPLREELEESAATLLGSLPNVRYEFTGLVANDELLRRLESTEVDVLVNSSESEGVPVSIMEGLARGIPTIAPAIGGIPEQIHHGRTGLLLPASFTTNDLADALRRTEFYKALSVRTACIEKWREDYSAPKNYARFVKELIRMSQPRYDDKLGSV